MEVTLILGGPRVCAFVANNLKGPHINQIKKWHTNFSFHYEFDNYRKNVNYVAELHRTFKERIGLKARIPYTKIEDETAIEPCPEYDQRLNIVWGYCGLKENHVCKDYYVFSVGDDEGTNNKCKGTYD